MNGKSIETNSQSKLNEDTMAKKQKSPDSEPTPPQDLAAARLVKTEKSKDHQAKQQSEKYFILYILRPIFNL